MKKRYCRFGEFGTLQTPKPTLSSSSVKKNEYSFSFNSNSSEQNSEQNSGQNSVSKCNEVTKNMGGTSVGHAGQQHAFSEFGTQRNEMVEQQKTDNVFGKKYIFSEVMEEGSRSSSPSVFKAYTFTECI